MKIKNLLTGIREQNKLSHADLMKCWGSPAGMAHMEKEYSPTDPSCLAIGLVPTQARVLSAGCGSGREVRHLININCNVTAIDNLQRMIDHSKRIAPGAEYLLADFSTFSAPNEFDFVLSLFNTINYLKDANARKQFIENSYKNLAPWGKLIITTKHARSHAGAFLRAVLSVHDFYYTPSQIDYWFKDTAFRLTQIKIGRQLLLVAEK